jgi:hypothetical protein
LGDLQMFLGSDTILDKVLCWAVGGSLPDVYRPTRSKEIPPFTPSLGPISGYPNVAMRLD